MVWHFIPSLPPRTSWTTQPPTSKAWPENCHMMAMTQPQEQVAEQFIQSTLLPILRNYLFNTCSKWTMDFQSNVQACLDLPLQCQRKSIKKLQQFLQVSKCQSGRRQRSGKTNKGLWKKFCGKSELVFFYCLLPSLQPASLEFCMLSPFETFTNMQVYTYNFFPLTNCHDRMTK